jgi:cytochrome c-type biogenesis protein CcmH
MISRVHRAMSGRFGWIIVVATLLALLAYGGIQSGEPQTQADRIDAITSQVACPICDGESVFESRNAASRAIRIEVDQLVRDNELSDEQILSRIENTYGSEVMLVPKSTGFDAIAWIAPVVVFVLSLAGLIAAFARWKRQSDRAGAPTDEDRRLVGVALETEAQHDTEEGSRR